MSGQQESGGRVEVIVPTGDLHAWPVRTEDGEHLGHVRSVQTDDSGHVVALDVRERWILGPNHVLPAGGMRLAHGAVVVPRSAAHEMLERELEWQHGEEVPSSAEQRLQPLPVFVKGRDGARRRFGGVDPVGSLLGALVAFGVLVLAGALLEAALDTGPLVVDIGAGNFDAVATNAMLATALALAAAGLLGGWAAGRGSRFDGVGNGLLAMAWLLGGGLIVAAIGREAGAEWNAYEVAGVPAVITGDATWWGTLAFLALCVVLLACAALGGTMGEAWHRRADRAMLDVVRLAPGDPRRPRRRRRPHDGMP